MCSCFIYPLYLSWKSYDFAVGIVKRVETCIGEEICHFQDNIWSVVWEKGEGRIYWPKLVFMRAYYDIGAVLQNSWRSFCLPSEYMPLGW